MSPTANEKYRVLVVDDDPSVLATYRRLLRRSGYTTVAESDPGKVLANGVLDRGFDLILVDYKMPAMDGLTFLSHLRRRECNARCILISAYLNDELRTQARNLGVDRVLDKPVDCCGLRQVISELLPAQRSTPTTAS